MASQGNILSTAINYAWDDTVLQLPIFLNQGWSSSTMSIIEVIAFWGFCMILIKFSAFTDAAMWYSFLWCSLRKSVTLLKFFSAKLTKTLAALYVANNIQYLQQEPQRGWNRALKIMVTHTDSEQCEIEGKRYKGRLTSSLNRWCVYNTELRWKLKPSIRIFYYG